MFRFLLGWYTVNTFLGVLANGMLAGAKFTLRPSLPFYIGGVTAQHSSSEREPNFAAFSRGRHLYAAEWHHAGHRPTF